MKKQYIVGVIAGVAVLAVATTAIASAHSLFGFGKSNVGASEDTAALLNMTPDELATELESKTLPELLDEKGVTHQQLYELRQTERLAWQAEILGITVDELRQQLEGKTFAQLLDEKGISHTQFQTLRRERMQAEAKEHLQQLVDDGTITQEQMQMRLDRMQERDGNGMGGRGLGAGMGMHGSL